MGGRRWLNWALFLGCWTSLGLLFTSQWYLQGSAIDTPVPWSYAFIWVMPDWLLWAALAPVVVWLGRRFPIGREAWRRVVPIHVAAAAALSSIQISVFTVIVWPSRWAAIDWIPFDMLLYRLHVKKWLTAILMYAAILGASYAAEAYRRSREREARLAEARLQALRMQLHPHFLFNALNTLSELIHRDPKAADRMVARLGDLLRTSLEDDGAEEVPLRRELEVLDRYLDIERTRFSDRLSVVVDVDEASLDARVPNLILQPLVENAIRHGIASRPGAGRIEIGAERSGSILRLRVRDDGPGIASDAPREGIGLGNTRARLEQLYGRGHSFELRDTGSGLEVALSIPFRVGERPNA